MGFPIDEEIYFIQVDAIKATGIEPVFS